MVNYKTAGDMGDQVTYKFLLYGDAGVGKTHMLASMPNILIVLTEPNGLATIREANPDAVVAVASTAAELRSVMGDIMSKRIPPHITSIGFDSLTEICRLLQDDIVSNNADGKLTLQDWGILAGKMRRLMRTIRSLEYNVFATALADTITQNDYRQVKPAFEGKKTAAEVAQYFNAVGYCYKRASSDGKSVTRTVMFDGPPNYTCKPVNAVKGQLTPDLPMWLDWLNNGRPEEEGDAEVPTDSNEKDNF